MKKSLISSHSAYHRPRDKLVTYYLTAFDLRVQRQNLAEQAAVIGRVTFASGEQQEYTDAETFLQCIRDELPNHPVTPQIPEPEIAAAVLRLYHKLKLGQETVLRPVLSQLQELRERELRSNRKISDIDNEIARISEQNLVLVRLKLKGYVDSALYLSQMDEIDRKLRELRKLRRRLLEAAGEDRQIHDTERMMEYLEDGPEWLDEVPSDLFGELLDRIIIISPERLKFRLLNGMELSENIERMVR